MKEPDGTKRPRESTVTRLGAAFVVVMCTGLVLFFVYQSPTFVVETRPGTMASMFISGLLMLRAAITCRW